MGRRIDRVAAAYGIDHGDAEALRRAVLAQHVGRAAPPVAKGAVMPDDDMRSADHLDHDFIDKRFGALPGELGVEMLNEQEIHHEPRDLALLDAKRREAEGLSAG